MMTSQPISIKQYGAQYMADGEIGDDEPIMEKMTAAEKKKYKK